MSRLLVVLAYIGLSAIGGCLISWALAGGISVALSWTATFWLLLLPFHQTIPRDWFL
jgi:hypothetical protein